MRCNEPPPFFPYRILLILIIITIIIIAVFLYHYYYPHQVGIGRYLSQYTLFSYNNNCKLGTVRFVVQIKSKYSAARRGNWTK